MNISINNPPVRVTPEEAIEIMDSLIWGPDHPKCYSCGGSGMYHLLTPDLFIETKICPTCEGAGIIKIQK